MQNSISVGIVLVSPYTTLHLTIHRLRMGLDHDLPNFPPSSPDALYSMAFSALVTIVTWLFECVLVIDLRLGCPASRACLHSDPRMVTLQIREVWQLVSIAIFMSQGSLPAEHPYRDVACGFSCAYIAGKFAFDVYHIVSSTLFSAAIGVRYTAVAAVFAVQLLEPLVCIAMLASLASVAAGLPPEMPYGHAFDIALKALRWSFTSTTCPLAIGGGLLTALLLLAAQRRCASEWKE